MGRLQILIPMALESEKELVEKTLMEGRGVNLKATSSDAHGKGPSAFNGVGSIYLSIPNTILGFTMMLVDCSMKCLIEKWFLGQLLRTTVMICCWLSWCKKLYKWVLI